MSLTAIIGGSGLSQYPGLEIEERRHIQSTFGEASAAVMIGRLNEQRVVFLPRHGDQHQLPPHRINYRANIDALKQLGANRILAVAAVGGISTAFAPGRLAVPDQIIDYTYGREQSFFSDDFSVDKHIDFTHPYDPALRAAVLRAGASLGLELIDGGTYGAVQGPRLETAAEIRRMAADGCDLVGMTGMPEAYLAREAGMDYATLAVVANWAAGISEQTLSMEAINRTLAEGLENVQALIAAVIGLQSLR